MIAYIFFGLGIFFMFFGVLGVLKFPDIYTRLQASSKCGITGVISIFLGLIIRQGISIFSLKILLISLFILITSPVASHIIAQSAFKSGLKPWRARKPKND
ncbi:cation:proton antiporter [Candidatus Desantisbacteria bacterium CG_4_10_14_0_8_um_filter_39_17]|uniref:Cation:proton antiporter n=1 Tax=Candidatus Desantisbacteria bacterium CG_4_10_14_0_8_um_filter_39_17 TaxID=1974542 RepID=A0A2H9PCS6_9BACT|nr:MAG: cation:proton antiporter [Candidatus Desantisbacteria bacterium CG_4_10_14_0_8_um_filter_39_17]